MNLIKRRMIKRTKKKVKKSGKLEITKHIMKKIE